MSETKFTKGEWVIKEAIAYKNQIKVEDKKGKQGKIIGNIRTREDAHLIAAAPDMYDMLHSIENDADQIPPFLWDKIQAVLAKARGEQ